MKTRLLSTLALLSLIVLASAAPASAQQPIPSIKQTSEFRSLKTYVGTLFEKRTTPATEAKKSEYRTTLKSKRTSANLKAKSLYNRKVVRISKQDDNKQRRQIKQIRQAQKANIAGLNGDLADRLNSLKAKETTAVNRINDSYGSRIQSLTNKRSILQKRLDKTTEPAKRDKITLKINAIQKQINVLVNAKIAEVTAVETKYDGRISNVNDLFAAKIERARASAASQIQAAKNAYKKLYREKLAAAKEKQTADLQLITNVRDRGADYIDAMPPAV